jgi:hypothetical protein
MRIDHCNDSVESRLSKSKKVFGSTSKNIALSPKTVEPNFKIVRRRLMANADVNDMGKA